MTGQRTNGVFVVFFIFLLCSISVVDFVLSQRQSVISHLLQNRYFTYNSTVLGRVLSAFDFFRSKLDCFSVVYILCAVRILIIYNKNAWYTDYFHEMDCDSQHRLTRDTEPLTITSYSITVTTCKAFCIYCVLPLSIYFCHAFFTNGPTSLFACFGGMNKADSVFVPGETLPPVADCSMPLLRGASRC